MTRVNMIVDGKRQCGVPQPANEFPRFGSHREARCFSCGEPLTRAISSGYPPGRGMWKGACPACQMTTHYDIGRPTKGKGAEAPLLGASL